MTKGQSQIPHLPGAKGRPWLRQVQKLAWLVNSEAISHKANWFNSLGALSEIVSRYLLVDFESLQIASHVIESVTGHSIHYFYRRMQVAITAHIHKVNNDEQNGLRYQQYQILEVRRKPKVTPKKRVVLHF